MIEELMDNHFDLRGKHCSARERLQARSLDLLASGPGSDKEDGEEFCAVPVSVCRKPHSEYDRFLLVMYRLYHA